MILTMASAPLSPRLFTGTTSSSSWRVRICLRLKGIDFDPVWLDASKAGPAAGVIGTSGQVPVLQIDGRVLSQSVAICE